MASASSSAIKLTKTKKKSNSFEKSKKKGAPSDVRNEGLPTRWVYEPPENTELAEYEVAFGEFDYDAVKGDGEAELWIIRAPASVQLKHLENLRIVPPSARSGIVGSIERKNTTYDVWAYRRDDIGRSEHTSLPGEELSTLSALLPRSKKGGRLYQTSKPITRHLVVTAPPARPTSADPNESSSGLFTLQNIPRFAYPEELLTHSFKPYGSESVPKVTAEDIGIMETDSPVEHLQRTSQSAGADRADGKVSAEKGSKRKVQEGSPKVHRTKKART